MNLRAIWDNRVFDAATLAASSAVASLPVTNLQDRLRKRVWRTTGPYAESVTANLGTPAAGESRPFINCVALINHNLTMAGTIRVQASATSDFAALLLDETFDAWGDIIGAGEGGFGGYGFGGRLTPAELALVAPDNVRVLYLAGTLEASGYWRVILDDPANPAGYLQVGRLYLSYYDEARYSFAHPWSLGGIDLSSVTYTDGGQPWTDIKPFQTQLQFSWEGFADLDKYWLFFIHIRRVGLAYDWIIDPFPEAVSARFFTTLYGRFTTIPQFDSVAHNVSEIGTITFLESL